MKHSLRLLVPLLVALSAPALAQDEKEAEGRTIYITPTELSLRVNETAQLDVVVLDANGEPEDVPIVFFTRSNRAITVTSSGKVEAHRPGDFTMTVRTARSAGSPVSVHVPVHVAWAELAAIEFVGLPPETFAGERIPFEVRVVDALGFVREDLPPRISSTNDMVAEVDEFGRLVAKSAGSCKIEASVEGLSHSFQLRVLPNPVRSVALDVPVTSARTGDVLQFTATPKDEAGRPVEGARVEFSFVAMPLDDLGPAATGQIEPDGRFVASDPGAYTVYATSAGITASRTIRARARDVQRRIKKVGHGKVQDVHTSDLWIWEGIDGRDYGVTGTWVADGDAIFWDVTDPANITEISRVRVDARTVNDVKVHPDGTLAAISREGASDRKNGFVLIDVANPSEPRILCEYTEGLTGGVHNLFIWNDHVFALSNGQRYDIVNIEDREHPYTVSSFELETPNHSIHDVWVVDGIAYSSNWGDGVYMVDVGNGVAGGSLKQPVVIGHYAYPSGWNHAAFPYHDEETGKFYVIAGDEAFPYGLNIDDSPTYPRGWLHFIDFTDPVNPKEVARYEVPEAGTHNLWVEDDLLYVAYYNGGVRVVDISGDLMGDLYEQGREVAFFLPTDPEGRIANAPMVWGPQPHKGKLFFSDWNSGLWSAEIEPPSGE